MKKKKDAASWCQGGKRFNDFFGKNIRIICVDGDVVTGFVEDYTSALDNEPDPESITVRRFEVIGKQKIEVCLCEVFAPEIDRIELIED